MVSWQKLVNVPFISVLKPGIPEERVNRNGWENPKKFADKIVSVYSGVKNS